MGIKNIKFEHRDGIEWVGWQQPNGDTTTDYVSQVMAGPDWELFRPAYEAWQADLIKPEDDRTRKDRNMGTASTATFETRDGEDWVTFTNAAGDTTSDKVARLKGDPSQGVEPHPEWTEVAAPAYEAWKAKSKTEKAKEPEAKTAPFEPDPDDDDDDAKAGAGKMRAPFSKGYKK